VQTKYVFVTGGVVSGLGKGITVASMGRLLKARGYRIITQKFEPYINIDPGNLSPYQHGEVFVTHDGAETDLDLGHYERFIDEELTGRSSITTGQIYWEVLNKERRGGYYGETVQVIPHITDEIMERICQTGADFVITEVGGTIGDIESLPVLEAIRQTAHKKGRENVVFVHITLVPYLEYIGEMKTKPSQHSVKELLSLGIQPDIIVCRSDRPIPGKVRRKLALFCNVDEHCVIQNLNADSLYEVPLMLEAEGFADIVCDKLKLSKKEPDLSEWRALVARQPKEKVTVGLVGGYVGLQDAYLSVKEALNHAGIHQNVQVNIRWVFDKKLAKDGAEAWLYDTDGIILPGGAGEPCSEGKIIAAEYARKQGIPFLGIGSGMHSAVIEFARNVANRTEAGSAEDGAVTAIIDYISPAREKSDRSFWKMGAELCTLTENTLIHQAYGTTEISERYRNYCTINPQYQESLKDEGLVISGYSKENVISIELPGHNWFVAVQFHPEYTSRITKPSPIFEAFVRAIVTMKNSCDLDMVD